MLNLPKDFREFIQLLNENNVKYLIVGGYAVAFHGFPRSTGDIDLFIENSNENANLVKKSLDSFGFSELGISVDDLQTPDQIIQLGYPPLRIDLLTSIDGINFQDAWVNKSDVKLNKLLLHFIGRQELIKNKKASNRAKDKGDIEELESS